LKRVLTIVGVAALAASLGCSHSSSTPKTNPTPTPAGGGSDVLYISGSSGGQCNDVKAYALPALTSLGSFDVSGSCAGAFAADNSGNVYAIEVASTGTINVFQFTTGKTTQSQVLSKLCLPNVPGTSFMDVDSGQHLYIPACTSSTNDIVNEYALNTIAPVRTLSEPHGNSGGQVTWPRVAIDGQGAAWVGFNDADTGVAGTSGTVYALSQFANSKTNETPQQTVYSNNTVAALYRDPTGALWSLYTGSATVAAYFKPGSCVYDSATPVTGDDVRYLIAQQYASGKLTADLYTSPNPEASGGLHDDATIALAVDGNALDYVSFDDPDAASRGVLVYDQALVSGGGPGVPYGCPDLAHTIPQADDGISALAVDSANNVYVSNAHDATVTQYAPGGQTQTGQITGTYAPFAPTIGVFGSYGEILVRLAPST
jgi:hypothetical protein